MHLKLYVQTLPSLHIITQFYFENNMKTIADEHVGDNYISFPRWIPRSSCTRPGCEIFTYSSVHYCDDCTIDIRALISMIARMQHKYSTLIAVRKAESENSAWSILQSLARSRKEL